MLVSESWRAWSQTGPENLAGIFSDTVSERV